MRTRCGRRPPHWRMRRISLRLIVSPVFATNASRSVFKVHTAENGLGEFLATRAMSAWAAAIIVSAFVLALLACLIARAAASRAFRAPRASSRLVSLAVPHSAADASHDAV